MFRFTVNWRKGSSKPALRREDQPLLCSSTFVATATIRSCGAWLRRKLFPEAYNRCSGLVFETRTMRLTGRVEADGQINGEKLEALRK